MARVVDPLDGRPRLNRTEKEHPVTRIRFTWLALALGAVALLAVACNGADASEADDSSAPGGPGQHSRAPELAPIDELELIIRESFPPQYALKVVSGLPSGCAEYDRTDVTREGNTITVEVWNSVINDPAVSCTMIYGMHEQTVELGTEFTPGEEYTVKVNDQVLTFTAQ